MDKQETQPQLGIEKYLESLKDDAERKGYARGQSAVLTKLRALLEDLPTEFNADDTEVRVVALDQAIEQAVKKQHVKRQVRKALNGKQNGKVKAPFGFKADGTPRKRKWSKAAQRAMESNLAKGRAVRMKNLKAKKVAANKKVVRRKKK